MYLYIYSDNTYNNNSNNNILYLWHKYEATGKDRKGINHRHN